MRAKRIEGDKLLEYVISDKDRFEDALRLLARIIAKGLLHEHSLNRQNASQQNKKEEKTDDV